MGYRIVKAIVWPLLRLFYKVRTPGSEQVPVEGPFILAANHQSFCDSLFIPFSLPRRITYLAKAEYFDKRFGRWFLSLVGMIPIQREGGSASERAIVTGLEVLGKGGIIALYPEGTRSLDEYLHRGHTGVARLAQASGVPVVPIGLAGTVDVQPVGKRMMRPFRRVTLHFGEPRYAPARQEGEANAVALRVFTDQLMVELSEISGRPYLVEYIPRPKSVTA
ncbi:MAG: lysophospholipid acyltransferase family protein [Actinobacteria bacterium]|nr:lysophospholipid acyltransferase family protein [Actinomycetota bacterium]